jgi:transcription elongation factor GreB
MSRAFVKESDDDRTAGELPERQTSGHVNYVTPKGLEALHVRRRELTEAHERYKADAADDTAARQKVREIERDQRYLISQIDRAVVVDPGSQPHDEVHFGATVKILDADGKQLSFTIVGEDEADVASGRISWASPLARALIGSRVGDSVKWVRPAGEVDLEVLSILYA